MAGPLSLENLLYLLGGLAVLYVFAAILGLHAGMTYANSGVAVATSLGTVFFLFLGVAVCMRIMMAFSGSFRRSFCRSSPSWCSAAWGCTWCWACATRRRPSAWRRSSAPSPRSTPSPAICSTASPLAVFLVTVAAYGFTTAAMLVPAI